jgi:hypothetical protein
MAGGLDAMHYAPPTTHACNSSCNTPAVCMMPTPNHLVLCYRPATFTRAC